MLGSKGMTISIYLDGDQYCTLLGVDLMEGLVGFGGTVQESIDAFCKDWSNASASVQSKAIESALKIESNDTELSEEVYQEAIVWIRGLWAELASSLPADIETVDHLWVEIGLDRSFVSMGSPNICQAGETCIEGRFPKGIRMSYLRYSNHDWRMQIVHSGKNLKVDGGIRHVVIGKFCEQWAGSSSVGRVL